MAKESMPAKLNAPNQSLARALTRQVILGSVTKAFGLLEVTLPIMNLTSCYKEFLGIGCKADMAAK